MYFFPRTLKSALEGQLLCSRKLQKSKKVMVNWKTDPNLDIGISFFTFLWSLRWKYIYRVFLRTIMKIFMESKSVTVLNAKFTKELMKRTTIVTKVWLLLCLLWYNWLGVSQKTGLLAKEQWFSVLLLFEEAISLTLRSEKQYHSGSLIGKQVERKDK